MTALVVSGATIIDAASDKPIEGHSILIEDKRIKAIEKRDAVGAPPGAKVIDARGKYAIPGLMNANVHLFGLGSRIDVLFGMQGHYEDVIVEAAQIALKSGLTTVFDTYGPRRYLMAVRDRINAGQVVGSRFFVAGNIVGFDGPLSLDFNSRLGDIAPAAFVKRINAIWVENVGRHLMWLTPEQVAAEIRTYIATGIDFLKYGSNEHFPASAGAFLAFSPYQQAAIVEESHRAGITAQAHSSSVEGLRLAIEAGCDLVTHCNITGPNPLPASTIELMVKRKTGAVIFPWTEKGFAWVRETVSDLEWALWAASDINARAFARSGARLMVANDGVVLDPRVLTDPRYAKGWNAAPDEESLASLDHGHVVWMRAMEEKGCPPMEMLRAATKYIADAYGKGKDLGTLEVGKIADLVILDEDPLKAGKNYGCVNMVIKDGVVVDRDALPTEPVLTRPIEPPAEEEARLIPAIVSGARRPT